MVVLDEGGVKTTRSAKIEGCEKENKRQVLGDDSPGLDETAGVIDTCMMLTLFSVRLKCVRVRR